MHSIDQLARMDADALREFAASLIDKVARLDGDNARLSNEIARLGGDNARLSNENRTKQLKSDQLTHEMAILKRWKFAAKSEQLTGEQKALFEEMLDADLEAIGLELEALRTPEATTAP